MPFLPDVIQLGPVPLSTTLLMGFAGIMAAYFLAGWTERRTGLPEGGARELLFEVALAALVGAKLYYVVMDPMAHVRAPLLLLLFPQGPWTLPIGAAAGLLYGAWRLRRHPDWRSVLDAALAPLTLALAIGFMGWKAPGTWAFAPATALAGLVGLYRILTAHRTRPGTITAEQMVLTAVALVLADLGRPVPGWVGVTALQLLAVAVGTAAWLWHRRQPTHSAPSAKAKDA